MSEPGYKIDDTVMALTRALAQAIDARYPARTSSDRCRFVEHLLPELLGGTADTWAMRQHAPYGWAINAGARMAAGVCGVYYGTDPATGERVAVVQHRKACPDKPNRTLGAVGGFMEPREKFYDAMARETREELCDDHGRPIFEPQFFRYSHLFSDVGVRNPPMIGQSFAYELNADEMLRIKKHVERLRADPTYRAKVESATGGEITLTELRPLAELASPAMRPLFNFSRQHDVYRATQDLLVNNGRLIPYVAMDPASPYYTHGRAA